MENYSNNNSKTIIQKYFKVFLVFIAICFVVAVLYFTGASKYLLGSLLNGVNLLSSQTATNHYAYGENIGWIDFDPIVGSTNEMQIGDNGLTGYAYGENIGWISLGSSGGPTYLNDGITTYGVNSSTIGCTSGYSCLTGYAYGENIGWIDFDPVYSGTHYGVKIDTATGAFSGYAYGENIGWISFSGTGYGVVTDWRPTILVSGITITGADSATTVVNGSTLQMSAEVLPANANNKVVTWSTTNGTGSATINSSGLLTATGVGTVTVTATATDGSVVEGTKEITVTTPNIAVTGVALNEHTATITVGDTRQLTDTVTPANATDTSVAWSSSNASVATVNSSGLVTAVAAGSVTITVTTTDGSYTDTDVITANPASTTPVGGGGGTNYYTISTQAGKNGFISPNSANIAYGSNQTFTIVPSSGYQVADVLVDGRSVGIVKTYTFSYITSGHTISATFSAVANNTPNTTPPTTPPAPVTWCHDFNKSLGWADSGNPEIIQLHIALQKEGISYVPDGENIYFEGTSQAVIQFQTKYEITPQTGYTGVKTRAKLNQLYGCTLTITPTTQQSDVLDYISQQLKNIKSSLPQGSPIFTQPTTAPPSNLQPTQPPSTQTPPQNQNLIIQILNKMVKLLKDLLDRVSK